MSQDPDTRPDPEGPDVDRTTTTTPRWVTVLAVLGAALLVLLVVALLAGHGPGRHASALSPTDDRPAALRQQR